MKDGVGPKDKELVQSGFSTRPSHPNETRLTGTGIVYCLSKPRKFWLNYTYTTGALISMVRKAAPIAGAGDILR